MRPFECAAYARSPHTGLMDTRCFDASLVAFVIGAGGAGFVVGAGGVAVL